jgi:hypothetical protein
MSTADRGEPPLGMALIQGFTQARGSAAGSTDFGAADIGTFSF